MNSIVDAPKHLELTWTLNCAALVFLMQAGFCLLEGGMVRTKNTINVAVKNLLDCIISTLVFGLFGFSLMFGADIAGLIGALGSVDFLQDSRLTSFFSVSVSFLQHRNNDYQRRHCRTDSAANLPVDRILR